MSEIVTGVIVAVIAGFITSKLGFGNNRTTISVQGASKTNTTKWKILIVIGSLMVFGGGYYGLAWGVSAGLEDARTTLGLCLFILGLPILALGKFGAWWSRN